MQALRIRPGKTVSVSEHAVVADDFVDEANHLWVLRNDTALQQVVQINVFPIQQLFIQRLFIL